MNGFIVQGTRYGQLLAQYRSTSSTQNESQLVVQQYSSSAHTAVAQSEQAASSASPCAHSSWAQPPPAPLQALSQKVSTSLTQSASQAVEQQ